MPNDGTVYEPSGRSSVGQDKATRPGEAEDGQTSLPDVAQVKCQRSSMPVDGVLKGFPKAIKVSDRRPLYLLYSKILLIIGHPRPFYRCSDDHFDMLIYNRRT